MKYLGKTTQDPYKYKGSGVRWVNHLKSHGNDVTTNILHECLSLEEVKTLGRFYSDLWKVVESDEWANLKPEEGDGAAVGEYNHCKNIETRKKIGDTMRVIAGLRSKNGTHNWSTRTDGTSLSRDRVNKGTHNFIGERSPYYDATIYTFVHEDGRVIKTTRHDIVKMFSLDTVNVGRIVKGIRKSHKGWRVVFEI